MLTITITAPPAPASSTASPFPHSFSARRTIRSSVSSPKPAPLLMPIRNIHFVETSNGGHCAFLARRSGDGIHWAEATVVRFLQAAVAGTLHGTAPAQIAASQLQ